MIFRWIYLVFVYISSGYGDSTVLFLWWVPIATWDRASSRQSRPEIPLAGTTGRHVPRRPGEAGGHMDIVTHGARGASPSPPSASHPTAPAYVPRLSHPLHPNANEPPARYARSLYLLFCFSCRECPAALHCTQITDVGAGLAGEAAGDGGVRRGRGDGRGRVPRGDDLFLLGRLGAAALWRRLRQHLSLVRRRRRRRQRGRRSLLCAGGLNYDPLSYAQNFDDGCLCLEEREPDFSARFAPARHAAGSPWPTAAARDVAAA